MARFKLMDIRPNPFRHLDRYPIDEKKITALRASIQSTGFWDNVVARVDQDQDRRPQIAYGHHRLTALREEYPPDHEVDLIIRDLSDEVMLKMMAAENMEEYKTDFCVTMETVRAVVLAYAEGKIVLTPPPSRTTPSHIRHAPSFVLTSIVHNGGHPYTIDSIAEFLGWSAKTRIQYALLALDYVDRGWITEDLLREFSLNQVIEYLAGIRREHQTAIDNIELDEQFAARIEEEHPESSAPIRRAARKRRRALPGRIQRTASRVADAIREGRVRTRDIRDRVREVGGQTPVPQPLPDINRWAMRLHGGLWKIGVPGEVQIRFADKFEELLPYRAHLSPGVVDSLVDAIDTLIGRLQRYRDRLREPTTEVPREPSVEPVLIERRLGNGLSSEGGLSDLNMGDSHDSGS